jgi:hypothetical protein
VLGVIGLVIGGIWVAVSTVNKRLEYAEINTGILQIISGLKTLYGQYDIPVQIGLDDVVARAQLAPASWIVGDSIITPSGYNVHVWVQDADLDTLSIGIDQAPKDLCVRLFSLFGSSAIVQNYGVRLLVSYGPPSSGIIFGSPLFNMTMAAAYNYCAPRGMVEITFYK